VARLTQPRGYALVIAIAAVLAFPVQALGGSFSRPVRLPAWESEWSFAVNDRGQALAAGPYLFPVSAGGRLGSPLVLPGVSSVEALALDAAGEVAVGFRYSDGTSPGSNEYHGGPGCCSQLGLSSWKLGQLPPRPQLFVRAPSPPNILEVDIGSPPALVVNDGHLTALWIRGFTDGYGIQESPTRLEAAFGPVGGPLTTEQLAYSPARDPTGALSESSRLLATNTSGTPFAAWVAGRHSLGTASGLASGALRARPGQQTVPGLDASGYCGTAGFGSDGVGDVGLVYFGCKLGGCKGVRLVSARPSGLFGRPRTIISRLDACSGELLVAPDGSAVVLAERGVGLSEATAGSLFGRFRRPVRIAPNADAHGWTVGRSHFEIVYTQEYARGSQLWALSADRRHGFGRPRRIAVFPHAECHVHDSEIEQPPIASSPNGRAIFNVACETYTSRFQYLIRYSP
jgi:hypothetical protein